MIGETTAAARASIEVLTFLKRSWLCSLPPPDPMGRCHRTKRSRSNMSCR
jgi:hypothetical protein